jgi:hypothetical protein
MYWQINSNGIISNEIFSDIKDIKAWFCTLASTFPCLSIEKQPKKKRLSPERLKFLAAFPIGVILAIKRTSFKYTYKR